MGSEHADWCDGDPETPDGECPACQPLAVIQHLRAQLEAARAEGARLREALAKAQRILEKHVCDEDARAAVAAHELKSALSASPSSDWLKERLAKERARCADASEAWEYDCYGLCAKGIRALGDE